MFDDFKSHYESAENINAFKCFEWPTMNNPYFPRREISRLKETLDPQTFRAMFTINWDVIPRNAVYSNYTEDNIIRGYQFNSNFETYISIDWGWAHPMACGIYQYDPDNDTVYLFDEIVKSHMTIAQLYHKLTTRPYFKTQKRVGRNPETGKPRKYDHITNVTAWVCDIAGDQEREQTGKANCKVYKESFGVNFKRKRSRIIYGVTLVRSYIQNAHGKVRFYVDEIACPKHNDAIKRYAYPEKDGTIQNENPVKQDDDEVDNIRYFFINILDRQTQRQGVGISMQ